MDGGSGDVRGIEFVQKACWVNFVTFHVVDAYMTQHDGSPAGLKD